MQRPYLQEAEFYENQMKWSATCQYGSKCAHMNKKRLAVDWEFIYKGSAGLDLGERRPEVGMVVLRHFVLTAASGWIRL